MNQFNKIVHAKLHALHGKFIAYVLAFEKEEACFGYIVEAEKAYFSKFKFLNNKVLVIENSRSTLIVIDADFQQKPLQAALAETSNNQQPLKLSLK